MTNQVELNRKLRAALEEALAPVPVEVFQNLQRASQAFGRAFVVLNTAWAEYEAAKTPEGNDGV